MALIDTARGNANILSNRVVVDMSNEIAMLKPRVSPLTVLSKRLNTKPCNNYKYEWMEQDMMARWTAINNGGAAYDKDSTDLVVDDETMMAVGDLIKSTATGEIMQVSTITAVSHTIKVVRGYGETAAHADSVKDNCKLLVVGNANIQGGTSPAEKYLEPTAVYNYTQIFKTPFSVTNTLEATKLYGGSELSRLHAQKGIEHAMSIEYALLFGERKLDVGGSQPLTTTGGVLKFLAGTDNVKSITKTTGTIGDLNTYCEAVFTYGGDTKVMLASPGLVTWISNLAVGKLEIIQSDMDKTLGLNVTKFVSPHGILNIIMHPLLVQGYADYGFVLDMDNVYYRPLTGRDTKLQTNIQANDEDGRRDQYITEAGLEIRLPKTHGILTLS